MSASVLYAGGKTVCLRISFPWSSVDELGLEQVLLLGAVAAAAMNCWWILLPESSKSAVWGWFFFFSSNPIPVGTGDSPQHFAINKCHVSLIFARMLNEITICDLSIDVPQ